MGTPIYIGRYDDVADVSHRQKNISTIFAHKSVALFLCMECSEIQVVTSSLTLID